MTYFFGDEVQSDCTKEGRMNQDEERKLIDAIIRDLNRKKKKAGHTNEKTGRERTAMKTIQRHFNTAVDEYFDCTIVEPMEIIGKAFFGGLVGMTMAVILYVAVTLI